MDRLEELIRERLEARAQDVEPTPALWREVDRRVSRRRWRHALTWSAAGVTAAAAAVLVLPAVFGLTEAPPELDIAPLDRVPVAGVVPEHALVVSDAGDVSVLDLGSGDLVGAVGQHGGAGGAPADVALGRTSTTSRVTWAVATATEQGIDITTGDGSGVRAATSDAFGSTSLVAAPDADLLAYLVAPPEADGQTVVVAPFDAVGPEAAPAVRGVLTVAAGSRLVEWTGQVADEGDRSQLWLRTADGRLLYEELEVVDGVPVQVAAAGSTDTGTVVLDAASSHATTAPDGGPAYLLLEGTDGPELRWDGDTTVTVPLPDELGAADPTALWLDAERDAALIGDGATTWLLAHDGDGTFGAPVQLDVEVVRGALFAVSRPAAEEPAPTPEEEASDTPPTPDPDGAGGGAALPAPVVTATMRDLVLHGPDGPQVLYTLPREGESTFLSVAVRPGSTADDLTIVALHLAEGAQDLRTYRVVDGHTEVEYWYDGAERLQVGAGGAAGDAIAAFGPVWHPAGDKLAWVEMGTSGEPNLRIIGWADGPGTGDTADDHTSFTLDGFAGTVLEPVDWVDLGGGRTVIRAVSDDLAGGWVDIPVEIQGDGAAAMPGPAEEARSTTGEGRVGGVAGAGPRWLLQGDTVHLLDDRGVTATLPPAFFPGEGLPDTWRRALGDGVLVGMSNTGLAYYVSPDGELARVGDGPWMDGDVVR